MKRLLYPVAAFGLWLGCGARSAVLETRDSSAPTSSGLAPGGGTAGRGSSPIQTAFTPSAATSAPLPPSSSKPPGNAENCQLPAHGPKEQWSCCNGEVCRGRCAGLADGKGTFVCEGCEAPLVSCGLIGCVNRKTCDKWVGKIGATTHIYTSNCGGKAVCNGWCYYHDDDTTECRCFEVKGGCEGGICCPFKGACDGLCMTTF